MRSMVTLQILIFAALLFSTGCGKLFTLEESRVDKKWGVAYEAAKHNQILNPNAQKNQAPVVGLDGQAAERNMDAYRKSFGEDDSKSSVNITIPTITGTGE
jgi:hypothetical protein